MSRLVLGIFVLVCVSACGGGGGSGTTLGTAGGGTAQVSGVSTPSQVSVVTPVE